MTDAHLTEPNPQLAEWQKKTPNGMAHWAGTGPEDKTCADCEFKGYYRESRHGTSYHVNGCEKFKKMTGRHGPAFESSTPACKYFSEK